MSVATDTTLEAPFLGLRYFDEEQSHLFFGREVQVNDILEKIRKSRLVTVMGSSGSGKSSLVRAGVVPSLKAGFLSEAGPRWRIAKMRPGSSPVPNLARELERALSVPGLEVTLRRGPLGLVQAVEECRLPANENVLVIADQFEELFRYQRESDHAEAAKEEAAAFVKLLLEATNQRAAPIYVLVTMRSDYLGNCAQFRDLPERINEGLYLVPRMRRDQQEQAITGPVAVEDAAIAPRLVQKLLNDTGDDPDQLPVLQHALLRAWNAWKHAPRPLDLEDLDAVGGMKDSLSRHADEIFDGLSGEQQRIARVMFQQLIDRDAEGREIRRPAPVAHIAAVADATAQAVEEIAAKFAAPEVALLYRNEDGHLDITHESLIRKWRLIQGTRIQGGAEAKGWMQEEVEARDQFMLLVDRTAKRDTLTGRALEDALGWRALGFNAEWARRYVKTTGAAASLEDVRLFVEECRKNSVRGRRLRNGVAVAALAAIAIVIYLIVGFWRIAVDQRQAALRARDSAASARKNAEEERNKAVDSQEKATASAETAKAREADAKIAEQEATLQSENANRQARAARVALSQASTQEAERLVENSRPGEALARLARALRSDPESLAARSWISDLLLNERLWVPGPPLKHQSSVNAVTFSPDGRRVVTASDDNTARVWDVATGQPIGAPLSHQNVVHTAVFSPDGRRVVTASDDDTARVWDAATGQPVGAPLQHQGGVMTAAFSPDGRRVVTASRDFTARVWDAATGEPIGAPLRHRRDLHAAAFSPDGRRVVTASDDFTARVWDAATGQPIGESLPHQGGVRTAAFSPDGRRVVTASDDNFARVWDAATGQPVGGPLPHERGVVTATFSPDGRRIVTASYDGTARVWDVASVAGNAPVGEPLQHRGDVVYAAVFSPDGRRVVTASADNTARVWDAATGQPVGAPLPHQGRVYATAFSPDGRRVVTASEDKTARVWDAATGEPVGAPLQHQRGVYAGVFSPDGHRVVTASADNTARVWDAATGQSIGQPLQHQDTVRAAAFSPDGRRVVTASADKTARVWDAATGQPIGQPLQHGQRVNAAVFSPDGRQVVTASLDKTARVWDTATGQPVGAPLQHKDTVNAAAFSPDGRRVITASDDDTARVWNAATGQPVGAALPHQGDVMTAAFSPDGRHVVTASRDDTARVWDAATGQPVGAALPHRGDVVTAAFSPDGRRVVTASLDNTARVWDTTTGQPVGAPLQHQHYVHAAAFSPDGRRVVTASDDSTARVWDAATGQPVGAPLQHQDSVNAAAFSPDGRRVVTASADKTARVWQVLLDLSSAKSVELLADLAEVVGGYRVTDLGSVVPLEESERLQRVRRLVGPSASAFVPFEVLLRRFLDTPR